MRPKKEEHKPKKQEFTHVHVREDGIVSEEEVEKEMAEEADDIEKGLQAIYKGVHTDLRVVQQEKNGLTRVLGKTILVLFLLCLGLGSTLIAWTWWKNTNATSQAIEVTVSVPASRKSGEETTVEISYKNPRGIALAQLSLDVNLPQGFHPSTYLPLPTDEEQLIWNIGTLGQYSDGKIILTGRWYSDVPENDRVQVVTTYRPANFNADFSSITTADIAIHESVLATTLTGPEKATAGEKVTYTVTFTNNGLLKEEGEGELVLPEGFVPISWAPELPAGGGTVWSLGPLEPGATFTQTVVGSFASEVDDLQEVKVIGFLKTTEGDIYEQGSASWFTDVQGGALSVVLAGNGSTSTVSVTPGEQLRVSVQLANISDADVSDAQILLDFQPESGIPISWSGANVGKAKVTAQGVVLASKDVGTLKPAERKTYSFTFPLKDELTNGQASEFTVTAFVTSGGVTVQSLPLTISLSANVSLSANARYYDESGALLGSGAFPPREGEETTFVISWSFTRALHAIDNATITATLPQNVKFQAVRAKSTGSVSYDESTRVLTWSTANIPDDMAEGSADIEIVYTPSDADVGGYGKLLSGSSFRGEDAETGAIITAQVGEITTEMPDDIIANGKGIVLD